MADETKILFIDTNGFLQVRDIKDVPWKELFPGVRSVDVMVAPRVIEELDKHKAGTNQRRRDRARLALQLIEKASLEPGFAVEIRDSPVRVRIVISNAPRFDWTSHPQLDPEKPDDQLVAEALSFGNGASIFSHDSGPRIRARIAQIPAYAPLAEWLLPIEQTDDQRKVTQLERDLARALSERPNIVAGFDGIDDIASQIQLITPILPPLDRGIADTLIRQYLAKHPRASLRSTSGGFLVQYGGISEEVSKQYQSNYSKFEVEVAEYYERLHEHIQRIGKAVEIGYFVKNESGTTAEGLRIEFTLEGDGCLFADRDDAEKYLGPLQIPTPPDPPRSFLDSFDESRFALGRYIPTLRDSVQPRDPLGFYWFERPGPSAKRSALQCQEFRATREFQDAIVALPTHNRETELDIHLHISAANLPAPANARARVIVSSHVLEWANPIVQSIFPSFLREQFQSIGFS